MQTILIVEDDESVRDSLSMALEDEGYRVEKVPSARDALTHLAAHEPPSCILLDLMMPVMSGFELRRRLLEDDKLAHVPTFVLTATAIDNRVRELNVHGWFRKPFSVEVLLSTLDRELRPDKKPRPQEPAKHRHTHSTASMSGTNAAHIVHPYEDERSLIQLVGAYLAEAASGGDGFVVIATPGHREKFRAEMSRLGVEPDALDPSAAVWLDAAGTLLRIMDGDLPNPTRFEKVISPAIEGAVSASRTGHVRAYGEMVNLLWRDGNLGGALDLEQRWNVLTAKYTFSLLCAYDLAGRDEDMRARLLPLCQEHNVLLRPPS
jgi:CheY-like chemotaxis protein